MKVLDENYVKENIDFIVDEIRAGKIFIYPTDTLYGLGCDATNSNSVRKIKEIKRRSKGASFLVMVPNLDWISKNTKFHESNLDLINSKLPGPYSFIVKLKNMNVVSSEILEGKETLGVRFPKCIFSNVVERLQSPFVSTSVNFSKEEPATSIESIDKEILNQVDYIIKSNFTMLKRPSEIIDIITKDAKNLR